MLNNMFKIILEKHKKFSIRKMIYKNLICIHFMYFNIYYFKCKLMEIGAFFSCMTVYLHIIANKNYQLLKEKKNQG